MEKLQFVEFNADEANQHYGASDPLNSERQSLIHLSRQDTLNLNDGVSQLELQEVENDKLGLNRQQSLSGLPSEVTTRLTAEALASATAGRTGAQPGTVKAARRAGWLDAKGPKLGMLPTYSKFWAHLRGTNFQLFKNEAEAEHISKAKVDVDIRTACFYAILGGDKDVFVVRTEDGQEYHLRADSTDSMLLWLKAMTYNARVYTKYLMGYLKFSQVPSAEFTGTISRLGWVRTRTEVTQKPQWRYSVLSDYWFALYDKPVNGNTELNADNVERYNIGACRVAKVSDPHLEHTLALMPDSGPRLLYLSYVDDHERDKWLAKISVGHANALFKVAVKTPLAVPGKIDGNDVTLEINGETCITCKGNGQVLWKCGWAELRTFALRDRSLVLDMAARSAVVEVSYPQGSFNVLSSLIVLVQRRVAFGPRPPAPTSVDTQKMSTSAE